MSTTHRSLIVIKVMAGVKQRGMTEGINIGINFGVILLFYVKCWREESQLRGKKFELMWLLLFYNVSEQNRPSSGFFKKKKKEIKVGNNLLSFKIHYNYNKQQP